VCAQKDTETKVETFHLRNTGRYQIHCTSCREGVGVNTEAPRPIFSTLRRGADKSLAFPISYLQHKQDFFLGWVKKLEQRSHKCVELRGKYVNTFFFSVPWHVVFFKKPKTYQPPT
jgi:hypothetical protein